MRWSEIITESSRAPLYHGSSRFGAISILKMDALLGKSLHTFDYWGQSKEPGLVGSGRRRGKFAEAEEFVVGDIRPLSRYLTGIEITQQEIDVMNRWSKSHGTVDLELILQHPLLKIV